MHLLNLLLLSFLLLEQRILNLPHLLHDLLVESRLLLELGLEKDYAPFQLLHTYTTLYWLFLTSFLLTFCLRNLVLIARIFVLLNF